MNEQTNATMTVVKECPRFEELVYISVTQKWQRTLYRGMGNLTWFGD
jgi:hypothetical protein